MTEPSYRDNLPPISYCGDPRAEHTEPMDVSPVRPSIPCDHLEPSLGIAPTALARSLGKRMTLIEQLAIEKAMTQRYKAMWLCEVLRGDHGLLEQYTVKEIDRASAEAPFWTTDADIVGNVLAQRES